jgi:hypothetical protein
MAFITEKEELKPGLILFRRGDVDHRMWYCRMKMPKADRSAARERAFDQDADDVGCFKRNRLIVSARNSRRCGVTSLRWRSIANSTP